MDKCQVKVVVLACYGAYFVAHVFKYLAPNSVMSNVMMNNNCQEYDFSMESLLLRCNKPFHFCPKDTQITFLHINF